MFVRSFCEQVNLLSLTQAQETKQLTNKIVSFGNAIFLAIRCSKYNNSKVQQDELSIKMSDWIRILLHGCVVHVCSEIRNNCLLQCIGCMTLTIALTHKITFLIYPTSTFNFRYLRIYLPIKLSIWEFVPRNCGENLQFYPKTAETPKLSEN